MKIPNRVKIGASVWKVRRVDKLQDTEPDKWLYGMASFADEVITLARGYNDIPVTESCEADTFLHEIIHCVSQTYGFALDERQVSGLAGGLLQVIRDSKLDFRK